jgi:hypothetical protein
MYIDRHAADALKRDLAAFIADAVPPPVPAGRG